MKNGKECSRIFLRVVVAAVVVFGAIGIVPWQLVAQEASQPAKADLPSIGDLGGAKKPARARADIQWAKVQEANLDANVNVRTYGVGNLPIWSRDGKRQNIKLLKRVILSTIDPQTWKNSESRVIYDSEKLMLIVITTLNNHRKIGALLDGLAMK